MTIRGATAAGARATGAGPGGAEQVPLVQRLDWVRGLRAALVVVAVGAALAGASPLAISWQVLGAVSVLYLVGVSALEEAIRLYGRRAAGALSPGLLADGLYLALIGAVTGGAQGLAPLLIVAHVAGVTLLASHRTGVKVALWHSLLIYGTGELQDLGRLTWAGLGGEPTTWVIGYIAVLWLVALGVGTLSAVNERELRRRRADLEALAGLATALESADNPAQVGRALSAHLADNFGLSRVVVLDESGQTVLGGAGLDAQASDLPPPGAASVLRRATGRRQTQLVSGVEPQADPGLARLLPDAQNLVVVPLVAGGTALGAVVAEHGPGRTARIERRVVATVQRFVDHGALALRTTRLLDEVRTLAAVDALTGLMNRRVFEEALRAELSRTERLGERAGLLLFDIDNFKAINDTYGHHVGDEVLRSVAATFESSSRDFDTVARWGGEEFMVLAPGCDPEAAAAAAERLRAEIARAPLPVSLTVSAGVAVAPTDARDVEGLLKAADSALYAAKAAGRNRIALAADSRGSLRDLPA